MFRSPTPVVKNILIINVAIFAVSFLVDLPINQWLGLYSVFSENFAVYQFFTYMWLHGDFGHIFWNMLMIFFLGPLLEQVWGNKRFLIFYLACGMGAGILFAGANAIENASFRTDAEQYVSNPNPEDFELFVVKHKSKFRSYYNIEAVAEISDKYMQNPAYELETVNLVRNVYTAVITFGVMVGASGALYGLLFAFAYLFPNTEFYIYFLFPVKAKYLAFALAMISIYSEFNRAEGDNVAHLAHLSGMLIAFILLKFWKNDAKRFY